MSRDYQYYYPRVDMPVYSLPMTVEAFEALTEHAGPHQYELIDGIAYIMAPPSPSHDQLTMNLVRILSAHLGSNGPCRLLLGQCVKAPDVPSCWPDIVISCDPADWDKPEGTKIQHRVRSPLMIVEILSSSTEDFDRYEKRERYQSIPSFEIYMVVEKLTEYVEVYRRSTGWQEEQYVPGQIIQLDQFDMKVSFEEIYKGVSWRGDRNMSQGKQDDPFYEFRPMQGVPMKVEEFEDLIEREDIYHYEMIGGKVYAMAPPSPTHDQITLNIASSLKLQLGKGSPCRVFLRQWVKATDDVASCEPDVLLTCNRADWSVSEKKKSDHRVRSPLIVVEVLSPSTQAFDRTEKRERYQSVSSFQVYILVNQDKRQVEVYRRSTGWQKEIFTKGQVVHLDQLDLELPLDEIYEGVL